MERSIKARLSEPSYGALEERYVQECLRSRQVTAGGPFEQRLEARLATHLDVPVERVVALSSGSAALHLALLAAGLDEGAEVIVPALTYIAPASAVIHAGGKPVIVPVTSSSGLMTPDILDKALEARAQISGCVPKAVIAVDFVGRPVDGPALAKVCAKYGTFLIEDACEALGATHNEEPAGSWGDISVFSFNGTKVTAGGSGGALRTSDTDTADRLRRLSNQGRGRGPAFDHPEVGFNYRISNLHAAIATAQMERLPELLEGRRRVADAYKRTLASRRNMCGFLGHLPGSEPSEWLPVLLFEEPRKRDPAIRRIRHAGFEARPLFTPLHRLAPLRDVTVAGDLTGAEQLGSAGLLLPSSASMTTEDVEHIADAVGNVSPARTTVSVSSRTESDR